MKKRLHWKAILIIVIVFLCGLYLTPTFVDVLPNWWRKVLPSDKIHLGLDLQGGMHLVMEVQSNKAVDTVLERLGKEIEELLTSEKIPFTTASVKQGSIALELVNEDDIEKVKDLAKEKLSSILHVTPGEKGKYFTTVHLNVIKKEEDFIKNAAVDQALETIRNRIDQFGVSEPTIQRQGTERILIELPGIKDARRAINIIGKTARLEFKLLDEDHSLNEALKGTIPEESEILYEKVKNPDTDSIEMRPYLVKKRVLLTGDLLTEARVNIDTQFRESYVAISFNNRGAKLFEDITSKNVGKRLAIVLDNTVYSAPVIRERIAGGNAQITGRFTPEEAHDLAIVLRAGALPAPVNILENRTVGPSLGKDSIDKGILSIIVGAVLVLTFMVMYYKFSGLIANFALFLNIVIILAILSAFKATLTLPGIAGILLTIGMAVDANVLIFERIREELRSGKTVISAVGTGYSRAFVAILDSNITTVITAAILFQFGTGPIRGFAITLAIGIVTSFFTALFVTRVIFDYLFIVRGAKTISI
ncbi:MAG: protein translocase subunit SecD [Thermodesulfobacteriota bacterium]|nr:protein translocase subunit SecD [Thermodesulfobacteriota bacterium]